MLRLNSEDKKDLIEINCSLRNSTNRAVNPAIRKRGNFALLQKKCEKYIWYQKLVDREISVQYPCKPSRKKLSKNPWKNQSKIRINQLSFLLWKPKVPFDVHVHLKNQKNRERSCIRWNKLKV